MTELEILQTAYDAHIDVIWAKAASDIQKEGVHLIEPSYQQILGALHTAIMHKARLVIIHSKLTWPYRN